MTAVAIHQPAYNPWLGYLHRIALADVFVFLDTVQFEKNSFTNRNRVRIGKSGSGWLTVPVIQKGHTRATLQDLKIAPQKWARKHLRTLVQNYAKTPHFDTVYPAWEALLDRPHVYLADLCWDMLQMICRELGIKTKLVRSSTLQVQGEKSDLVLNIVTGLNGRRYISGPQGRDYLKLAAFRERSIEVVYHDYQHPPYPQSGKAFIPFLGVFDFLCEVHPDQRIPILFAGNE